MKDDMNIPDRWIYRREYAERNYPPGTRIRLLNMSDDPNPVPASCRNRLRLHPRLRISKYSTTLHNHTSLNPGNPV